MKRIFTLSMVILITLSAFTQVPQKMSYQCVIRNASGVLVTNQNIGIRISVLQGTASGSVVYQETYNPNPQTNANGLVTVEIGAGVPISGTFSVINWTSGPYFLKTETDPTGGTNYSIVGTSQLLSVPYAQYAKTAGNGFSGNYNDLSNKPTLAIVATSGSYNDLTNKPTLFNGSWAAITGKPSTLAGYGITDGMNVSHAANGITSTLINNWNAAFSWGNHSGLYRPISYIPAWNEITGKPVFASVATSGLFTDLLSKPTTLSGYGITNGMNTSHPANGITSNNISSWTTAYGWGNHASAGYAVYPSLTGNDGKFLKTNGTSVSWGTLASVASSGSYNDLKDKPSSPGMMPSGNNNGDMLYWNGSAWIPVTVGLPGQYLQLSQSNIPTWIGAGFATVSTSSASLITANSSNVGGDISSDGGSPVTSRGICYSTSINPTIASSKVTSSSGIGGYICTLPDLTSSTLYYARAFATNSVGIAYGNEISFTTLSSGGSTTVSDIEGNIYHIVTIGTQNWLIENLKTKKYRNGDDIPTKVADFTSEPEPKYQWAYNNDENTVNEYGRIYTWYVINDSRGVCPTGYHVPSNNEYNILQNYLINNGYGFDGSGSDIAKSMSVKTGWNVSNIPGTPGNDQPSNNSTGFTGVPAGSTTIQGTTFSFVSPNFQSCFWTSTPNPDYIYSRALIRRLYYSISVFEGGSSYPSNWGYSIRCIKDN